MSFFDHTGVLRGRGAGAVRRGCVPRGPAARRLAEERLAKGEVPLIMPDVEIGINLGLAR